MLEVKKRCSAVKNAPPQGILQSECTRGIKISFSIKQDRLPFGEGGLYP
jgi:hypothetical protein